MYFSFLYLVVKHIADIFYICVLMMAYGPVFVRATIHGIILNTVQSLASLPQVMANGMMREGRGGGGRGKGRGREGVGGRTIKGKCIDRISPFTCRGGPQRSITEIGGIFQS